VLALLVLVQAPGTVAGAQEGPGDVEETRPTDLVERTEARLAQVDVTVMGPPEIVMNLRPEDFYVKVNLTRIEEFTLDRLCDPAQSAASQAPDEAQVTAAPFPVSYLFYYDQSLLTLAGRQRSLDLSRNLVRSLIAGGSRGMIVSSAGRVDIIEPFTTDPRRLLDALDRLERDRTQWDFFATEEESRVEEIVRALNEDDNIWRAFSIARSHHREERWRTDKSLRRLAMALTWLAENDSRNVVVYFADTLRSNPGEHYLSFFGSALQRVVPQVATATGGVSTSPPFDQLVNEAVARGIRFYPVHAEGLVTPSDDLLPSAAAVSRTLTMSSSSRVRFRDAQNTLASLATETGGNAFLHGNSGHKVAARIRDDFSCVYLISLDPGRFAEDAPLRLIVKVPREDVTARSRGRLYVQSESTRLTARLLNAFASARPEEAATGIRTSLVPTGFREGAYSGLVQIYVPATALPSASWKLGATILTRDEVREEISGGLSVARPGVPMILEREVTLKPGLHEITSVAHEETTGFVLSDHLKFTLPDPNDQPVTCGPIVLLQPGTGAFLRGEDTRTSGSVAWSDSEPIDAGRPTVLMGLVCRGKRMRDPLRVERSLTGEATVPFPPLDIDLEDDRCAQVRDLIPTGSMGPGQYRYLLRAMRDGETLHECVREFHAVNPDL
jgi:VWFA-related protein